MTTGKLTEVAIKAAIARSKRASKMIRLSDGGWLTLLITPAGIGRWQQCYRYGGKARTVSFGSYPPVTIGEAREKALKARALIRDDIDPVEHRRFQKAEIRRNVHNTFGHAAEGWFTFNEPRWARATSEKARQYLDKDLLPALRLRPIANITTEDLGAVMARIEKRGAHNVAKKTRQWCNAIYRYAIARGWTKTNPAELLGDIAVQAPEAKNYSHLGPDELPELINALDHYTGSPLTKGAIWLALWTGNRPGIIRTLRWNEIDVDQALWTVEKNRDLMKLGYSHLTPLPRQAVALLRDLHRVTGAFPYVFAGRNDPRQPLSDAAVNKGLALMGFKGRQTAHGFRHLISTSLNERGYERDWVERQLAHGDPDKIRGTYNKAHYLEPRRKMMQEWADLLESIQKGQANVVSIKRSA